jgi:nicotinamidase-related amidase
MRILCKGLIPVLLLGSSVFFSFAGDLPPDYVRKGEKVLVTLEETIDPRHTALVIVDVQNDFVYGKGQLSSPPGKVNPCEEILSPLNAFIDKCRKLGVPVIYTFTVHAGDLDLPPYKARMIRRQTAPVCLRGSKGAEFPDRLNKPLAGDPIVTKHGFDAFADGDLHTLLQNRGIKSLIFSGIDSAVCVGTTLRHGFHLGYYVVMAKDLSASPLPSRQECAIDLVDSQFGFVTTSKNIMQLWDKAK